MWKWNFEEDNINICDGVRGVVTSGCSKGLFLTLENGETAFAKFGGLLPGTTVFCTVLKKATDKWKTLVAIDSVLDVDIAA